MGKISDLENGGLEKNSYDFFNSPAVPNYYEHVWLNPGNLMSGYSRASESISLSDKFLTQKQVNKARSHVISKGWVIK